jgi:hypothetical protein
MAGVEVTIVGTMTQTGLGVGGGPMPGGPSAEHPIAPGGRPPHPAHPIAPGGSVPPLGTWGGAGEGFPTHPIVIPPEFISDVHPEHPIVIPPVVPTHPIVIPPDVGIWPPDAKPEHPIVIPPPTTVWPPVPTHPIVIPPDAPPQVLENWNVVAYWTEEGGWGMAIVPSESHPGYPAPAK